MKIEPVDIQMHITEIRNDAKSMEKAALELSIQARTLYAEAEKLENKFETCFGSDANA